MAKLGTLVVELAAKIRDYVADMNAAATATEASATRMERAERTMAQAAKDAATGQADMAETAAQVASRMGPIGGAVAAAAAVVAGYALVNYKAAQENTALVRAMALSGNQAGVTAGQLQGLAGAASQVVGTHGQAVQAIGQMVSGGKVAAENLQALTVTALNAQRTLGLSVADTVKRYEELGEAPTKASRKLNEALGYLNAETYRRIQALEDMGKKDEAAALAQLTYAKGLDDATKKVEASLGTLQRTWRSVGEAAGKAWDWMLGLGRKDDVQDQLAGLRTKLEVAERKLSQGFATTGGGAAVGLRGQSDERRAGLQAEADALREQISLLGRAGATAAQNAAASARYQKDGIEWADKAAAAEGRLKTNAQKRTEAIDEANKALRNGHVNAVQHAALVADAEARFADKAAKGAKAASDAYAVLGAEIQKQLDLANDELVAGRALTASEKLRIDTLSKIDEALRKKNITVDQAIALEEAMTVAQTARQAVEEKAKRTKIDQALFAQQVQIMDEEAAHNVARSKAWEQSQLALVAYNQSVQDQIDLTQVELGLVGQTQQSRDLALTYYRIALELKKQIRAIDESEGYDSEAAREAARERARAAAEKARLNAKTQSQVTEWNRVFDQVENGLTDALMRGFEAGKSMFANLRDYASNLFKTMVLRPVVSAVVNPVAGAIAGAMGLPSAASAATGSSSLSNAMGFAGTASAFGTGMGAAFTSIVQAGVGGWATAAGSLIGTGTMSGVAAGLGMIAGPLMAVVAVASLLKGLDDSGTLHTGGMASYSATGGLQTSTEHGAFGLGFGGVERGDQTVGMVSGLTKSIVGILDATATTFGKTAGYQVATAFADDTSKDGAWGGLLIKGANGQTAVNWNDSRTSRWAPREFADGETGAKQYALAVAKDVRDVLIDETPAWADTMLTALGDAPTLEQLAGTVAQIHAAAAAFDTMGRASEQFAALSESAMDALVTAMGGAEAAVAGLGNYYSSFYTDAERADVTRGQLQDKFTGLGLGELPQTRDQFRSIVESLDLTTVSGRAMYAELIKLSPAFASITAATQDAGAAMAAAAEEAARAAEQAFEKAKTTAYSQLEASAERERALWEQQASAAASLRDEVRGVFDTLATNIRELRGEALGPELTAAQGQAFIASALASVNAGTGLPDGEGLANAIAAVRGGLSSPGMYANSMERDFAALRLAGELTVLQEAAGEQLTTAELQLQAAENQIDQLDETLAYWRKLIDGTEDGIDATKSVEEAVKALTLLMFPEDTAGGAAGAGAGGSGFVIGGTAPGSGPARPAPAPSTLSRLGNTYYGAGGTAITDVGYVGRFDGVNSYVNTLDWSEANKGASAAALTAAANQYGVSAREISIATGMPQADVEALLPGIPRYLLGTNYVPETGLALLHKGEAVVPEVYNPMAGAPYQPMGGGDNGQVVALLQQIAARVTALEGHAATSADANAQSADVLTRVAQGNSLTTSAAPAIA